MSKLAHSILFLSTFAVASALAPAFAETIKYKADLSSANEVPPNDTGAKGTIEATYDSEAGTLSWSGSYSGLSGPEIAVVFPQLHRRGGIERRRRDVGAGQKRQRGNHA